MCSEIFGNAVDEFPFAVGPAGEDIAVVGRTVVAADEFDPRRVDDLPGLDIARFMARGDDQSTIVGDALESEYLLQGAEGEVTAA